MVNTHDYQVQYESTQKILQSNGPPEFILKNQVSIFMINELIHIPVLLDEILDYLNKLQIDNGIIVDATFGLGGYSKTFLEKTNCNVFAFDRDPQVDKYAQFLKATMKNDFNFIILTFLKSKILLSLLMIKLMLSFLILVFLTQAIRRSRKRFFL